MVKDQQKLPTISKNNLFNPNQFTTFVTMWTTKETKRVYRGVTIWKFEGSKLKESFKRRDPRTIQKDDSRFTKWHSYQVEIFGGKYDSELLRDVKEYIDSILDKI